MTLGVDDQPPVQPDLLDTPQAGPAAVRGGAMRVVGYVAGVALSVGSSALLFRHLGVVDSGRYVTVLALIAIVLGVTDVGLTTIGVRELAVRGEAAKRRLMRNLLGVRLTLATLGIAGATAFAVIAGYEPRVIVATPLAGVGVIALSAQGTLSILLLTQLRLGWVTLLELIRQTAFVGGIVALVLAGAGLVPLLAMQGPPAVLSLLITAWIVRGRVPLIPAFETREWAALLREVLPFSAATIVTAVYFRAALIVLGLVSTAQQTGYFGSAYRVTEVLLSLPNLMVGAAFPIFARAARDDEDRLAYGVERVFRAVLLLGGSVAVALVLGAPFVIDVVAGNGFAPAADVLRLQAFALMVSFASATLLYALLSLRLHTEILVTSITMLAVNVALAWALGARHGATGAAIGTLLAELAGFLVVSGVLFRRRRVVLPSARILPPVGLAVGLAALVLLIPGLPAVAAAALGLLIYVGVVLALRVVPPELLMAFRQARTTPSK